MADFSSQKGLAAFKVAKEEQLAWALASGLPGLQSAVTNRTYALTMSHNDFYETVLIGQVPRDQIEGVKGRDEKGKRTFTSSLVPEARKERKNKAIDLTDEQVVEILDLWSELRSCLSLPFVASVWGHDGERTPK